MIQIQLQPQMLPHIKHNKTYMFEVRASVFLKKKNVS